MNLVEHLEAAIAAGEIKFELRMEDRERECSELITKNLPVEELLKNGNINRFTKKVKCLVFSIKDKDGVTLTESNILELPFTKEVD